MCCLTLIGLLLNLLTMGYVAPAHSSLLQVSTAATLKTVHQLLQ